MLQFVSESVQPITRASRLPVVTSGLHPRSPARQRPPQRGHGIGPSAYNIGESLVANALSIQACRRALGPDDRCGLRPSLSTHIFFRGGNRDNKPAAPPLIRHATYGSARAGSRPSEPVPVELLCRLLSGGNRRRGGAHRRASRRF